MKADKKQERAKVRAGYGEQPWFKIIALVIFTGIRWRLGKQPKEEHR